MTDINSRALDFVRRIAMKGYCPSIADGNTARAIVAELDGNVDAEAMREVLQESYGRTRYNDNKLMPGDGPMRVEEILAGNVANWEAKFGLACIAKGRELALAELQASVKPLPTGCRSIAAPKDGTRIQNVGISDKWECDPASVIWGEGFIMPKIEVPPHVHEWKGIAILGGIPFKEICIHCGLERDISLDDKAKPAKETRAEFEDRNKNDPLCCYGGHYGY